MMMTEDEAEFILREIIVLEQERTQRLLKPFMDELGRIACRRPPRPVELPDGTVAIYRGPSATDIAGRYAPPRWLEQMALEDAYLRHALDRYRAGGG
jgi:hypothetical protein